MSSPASGVSVFHLLLIQKCFSSCQWASAATPTRWSPASPPVKGASPPPSSPSLLAKLYGDLTCAPRIVRKIKKKIVGKIKPIPINWDEEEEKKEKREEMEKTGTTNSPVALATGDSYNISLDFTPDSPSSFKLSNASNLGVVTPPANRQFLRNLVGELTNAPSSDRSASRRFLPSSTGDMGPIRLNFDQDD